METKRNSDNNDSANLELVLEQFANGQKSQTKSLNDLALIINNLSEQLINFKEKLDNQKQNSASTDTLVIQEMVKKGVTDIKLIVATNHPKPILKKYQFLLFPEQDAKMFYKIVFGRWFLWLIVMLLLTNLYKFSIHYTDTKKEIDLQLLENNRIKQAWFRLYDLQNKSLKRLMDSAYYKAQDRGNR